jgi:hypothetical protein
MDRAISAPVDRSVIDPTLRLALIFRSLGDRPCEPLVGWRTTPWRIGRAFRPVGCPSDSGPRASYRHGPQAHKAAGSDRPYRTIWYGLGGVSRKTTCEVIGCYRSWSRRNATPSVPIRLLNLSTRRPTFGPRLDLLLRPAPGNQPFAGIIRSPRQRASTIAGTSRLSALAVLSLS